MHTNILQHLGNILQEQQDILNNTLNNSLEKEYRNKENMYKALENIECYTIEDLKNDLLPVLNNFNKRLEILENKYSIVNNLN